MTSLWKIRPEKFQLSPATSKWRHYRKKFWPPVFSSKPYPMAPQAF